MEELDDYSALVNDEELDRLERLRHRLEYFFMDPIQKWKKKNTRPWKLLVQILKIYIFTTQLVIFGTDMAKFINYKEEMQITLKQLFLRDWDPSADAIAYPGPYVPYAVYTKNDFVRSVNYAINVYSNITDLGIEQFGYQSNKSNIVSPIGICMTNFVQADFDPTVFKYNYSTYTNESCSFVENFAEAGNQKWQDFDFKNFLEQPLNFKSLVSAKLNLPIRTILLEAATTGYDEIVCFNIDVEIFYDNTHRTGQIIISLTGIPKRAECNGQLTEHRGGGLVSRQSLYVVVLLFCLLSFSLCARSLWKSFRLMRTTEIILNSHGKRLTWSDRLEFVDFWLILIILNDLMVSYATTTMLFYNAQLLETYSYTTCSLLLGQGNFMSWLGLIRYLSFFRKYNLLIVTLRKSFFHVMRFMLCTFIIYSGFCFCGWVVFGPYHFKFRELSTTTECLFSLINGDDMFETFALLKTTSNTIWWFSRVYLYLFVSLFIYVVLSLFIALIMDAYEMIKQYSENGFPKGRLDSFYLDGDMSKLKDLV